MIILDCIQGEEEWRQARLGIPTASNFSKIITSTGKASTSSEGYMNEIVGDYLAGTPEESYTNANMDRGIELEEEARNAYEFIQNVDVTQVGLVYKDERKLIAASPDGLIGDDGGYEVKCPKRGTHVGYSLKGVIPSKYIPQVQGCMWICESEWWDFMSYCPGIDPFIIRVNRDEKYISTMSGMIESFLEKMLEKREKLKNTAIRCN